VCINGAVARHSNASWDPAPQLSRLCVIGLPLTFLLVAHLGGSSGGVGGLVLTELDSWREGSEELKLGIFGSCVC
jgi:hypothetical protein